MSALTDIRFSFVSHILTKDTFSVLSFTGVEGLSRCYEFEIELASTDPDIVLDEIMQRPVTFTIHRDEGDIPFHGILTNFEQHHAIGDLFFYQARMAPKLWWLSLTHHNQVFLNMTAPEFLTAVLKDAGLTTLDFELRLQGDYKRWEYICQYRESHLDFLSRWMEREGIYYFFEQTGESEKVILTDSNRAHTFMTEGQTVKYAPPSGLDSAHREEVIKSLICRQQMLPEKVFLKDYNYRTPSLDMSGSAGVAPGKGRGQVFIYGDHFQTPEEGNRLATIRSETYLCREKLFIGESVIPYLRPGYTFELQNHFRPSFNQRYLTLELTHHGNQTAYLVDGLKMALSQREKDFFYRNSFTAIPATSQFRAEIKTPKARFYGSMNAHIDAQGSGEYAELDDQGRYKVVLPFDLADRLGGKASTWIRMAQPSAGSNHGMHFPLHKGTEVLLTFIDGDPDRPIISGALPNPENPSVVNSDTATRSGFRTSGGGSFHFENQKSKEKLYMHAGDGQSVIGLGSSSPPELFQKSGMLTSVASLGSNELVAGWKRTFAAKETYFITGYQGLQRAAGWIEKLISSVPELAVKASERIASHFESEGQVSDEVKGDQLTATSTEEGAIEISGAALSFSLPSAPEVEVKVYDAEPTPGGAEGVYVVSDGQIEVEGGSLHASSGTVSAEKAGAQITGSNNVLTDSTKTVTGGSVSFGEGEINVTGGAITATGKIKGSFTVSKAVKSGSASPWILTVESGGAITVTSESVEVTEGSVTVNPAEGTVSGEGAGVQGGTQEFGEDAGEEPGVNAGELAVGAVESVAAIVGPLVEYFAMWLSDKFIAKFIIDKFAVDNAISAPDIEGSCFILGSNNSGSLLRMTEKGEHYIIANGKGKMDVYSHENLSLTSPADIKMAAKNVSITTKPTNHLEGKTNIDAEEVWVNAMKRVNISSSGNMGVEIWGNGPAPIKLVTDNGDIALKPAHGTITLQTFDAAKDIILLSKHDIQLGCLDDQNSQHSGLGLYGADKAELNAKSQVGISVTDTNSQVILKSSKLEIKGDTVSINDKLDITDTDLTFKGTKVSLANALTIKG